MDLVTGKFEPKNLTSLWQLWTHDLKVSFPKRDLIDSLVNRWGITEANVYGRLRNGKFKNVTTDLAWLYENYSIGYDLKKGFFFDESNYEAIKQREEMECAKLFGMSK